MIMRLIRSLRRESTPPPTDAEETARHAATERVLADARRLRLALLAQGAAHDALLRPQP